MNNHNIYLMWRNKKKKNLDSVFQCFHSSSEGAIFFFNKKVLIFILFLHKNICCGNHKKRLVEVLQMSTYNICFC